MQETYTSPNEETMTPKNDEIVETSVPHRMKAVVSTNAAPEVQSMDALMSTKSPPSHNMDVLVSKNPVVVEKDISHGMEYTAGMEKEGWIVGDITYKQTKDGSTTILKGDVLFLGITPTVTQPRLFVRVDAVSRFRIRLIQACRLQACSDSMLEIILHVDSVISGSQITEISVRPFIAEGQKQNVLRRLNYLREILSCSPKLPDLRFFPHFTGVLVPSYCRKELDSYHSNETKLKAEFDKNHNLSIFNRAQKVLPSGLAGSKRARNMANSLFGENPPKASSNVRGNTLSKANWLNNVKVAQGRGPLPKSSTPMEVPAQNKISRYFEPRQNFEGFKNLGNTCYISAVVSMLLSLPALAADIEAFSRTACTKTDSSARVLNAFQELFQQIRMKNHGVLNLASLKNAVAAQAKRFKGREQQDAHEFYSSCLDLLTTEIQQIIKKRSKKSESEFEESGSELSRLNVTDLNFTLRIKHTLVCTNSECNYKRSRGELFREISLSIPEIDSEGSTSTHDILDSFFDENHLDYNCEKCGHLFARATHKVSALPRYLVLHLKRFKPNYERGVYEKSITRVDIPFDIDLTKYCTGKNCTPPECSEQVKVTRATGQEIDKLSEKKTCDRSSKHATSPYCRKLEDPTAGDVVKRLKFDSQNKSPSSGQDRPKVSLHFPSPESKMRDHGSQRTKKDQAASENSDLLTAIELSKQDSGHRSPRRDRHESRFDKAEFTLGDEDEDLRRALELSQAIAMDDEAQLAAALEESRADQPVGDLEIDLVDEADEGEGKSDAPSPQPEETSEEDSDGEDLPEEDEDEAEPPIPVNGKYHLHAVVNHSGVSASSGHYVSDVLDEAKGQWQRYDDSLVTKLTQMPRDWSRSGYLLVYCHSSCFR